MSDSSRVTEQERIITYREEIYKEENIFNKYNKVWISGVIQEEFEYSHMSFEKKYYKSKVKVVRENPKNADYIEIIVSESDIPKGKVKGRYVEIGGYLYSCKQNWKVTKKHLYLFSRKINFYESEEEKNENAIYLEGSICKKPIYRKTPKGKAITELMVAVPRGKKEHFIPCIAWYEDAEYASNFNVEETIKLYGRIESRIYFKKYEPNSEEGEFVEINEILIMEIK